MRRVKINYSLLALSYLEVRAQGAPPPPPPAACEAPGLPPPFCSAH